MFRLSIRFFVLVYTGINKSRKPRSLQREIHAANLLILREYLDGRILKTDEKLP